MRDRPTRAAQAMEEALRSQLGPDAAAALAAAQARIAWQQVVEDAGLGRGGRDGSELVAVRDGVARVEVGDGMLAQELNLRREALRVALNRRMAGRPGVAGPILAIRVSVGRRARIEG